MSRRFLAAIAPMALAVFPAHAANYTVTTRADSGAGSLREAIALANANPGPDVVLFAVPGVLDIRSALPVISDDLGIYGAGASPQTIRVDNGVIARALQVGVGVQATLDFLAIEGGRDTTVNGHPGYGGCIANAGQLTLTRVQVRNCLADDGAAIHNAVGAELTLEDSLVESSVALRDGAGIHNSGTLRLQDSIVRNGYADRDGAGIYNAAGADLRIVDSTLSGNVSNASGGGICNAGGSVEVDGSTLSGNLALLIGGGILTDGSSGSVIVRNSTLSGNATLPAGQIGGSAIGNQGSGSVTLIHATLADNSAPTAVVGGFRSKSSIFANADRDCVTEPGVVVVDLGQNLAVNDMCSTFEPVAVAALKLGPLADNGGATQTRALLPGSVAIDHAADCTDDAGLAVDTDQRGHMRPVDGDGDGSARCDAGAYESGDTIFADGFDGAPITARTSGDPHRSG